MGAINYILFDFYSDNVWRKIDQFFSNVASRNGASASFGSPPLC